MFNPEMGSRESQNEGVEEKEFTSEKGVASWSGEAEVFTVVESHNGKHAVVFMCDNEGKLPDNSDWLDLAPTTTPFDNYDDAVEYAKKAFDDRDNWQDPKEYN